MNNTNQSNKVNDNYTQGANVDKQDEDIDNTGTECDQATFNQNTNAL